MSSPELTARSLAAVIIEASVFLVMNVVSITGNALVFLAVYRNQKLRSTINLYITALAASDLLCATVEMPSAAAVLITGRWNFGVPVCQLQGFLDVFVTYSTPATMGLLALNRYIRIVKTNHYNGIFSPRKSKIWLSCVWLSLALYLLIARVTNWSTFEFIPGYAVCSVDFSSSENRIVHYSFVLGLFFILPFSIGLFSYFKIFLKIRQHKFDVAPSLQNSRNQAGRISMQEINMSRALSYVAAGFLLCWIPMWGFTLWKRFSPDTASRIVELSSTFFLFLSSTINPFIYAAKNRAFREEFRKLLCWWKKGSTTSKAGSCASGKRCRGGKTPESSTSWPESFLSLPGDCKEKDWRNPGNEVAEIFL